MRSFNSISQCLYDIVIVFVTTCIARCGVFMRAVWPQRTCMFKRHTMMRAAASARRVGAAMVAVALVTASCQVTVSPPTPSDTTEPTFSAGPALKAGSETPSGATVVLTASEDATLYWVLYEASDATPDTAATVIGHAIASGGIQRGVVDITTDTREIDLTGLAPDTPYNFYAVLQDAATNTSARSARVTLTTIPQGHPDLTVTVTANPTAPTVGQEVTLSATVTNRGAAAAAATTLQWYRSATASSTSADTPLGSAVAVAALAADAASNALNITATAPTTPGTVYYGVCVTAVAGEATVANNCTSVAIPVTAAPKADLTVAVAAPATSVVAGGDVALDATVTNSGAAAAAPTTLKWYRSSDAAITATDTPLGSAVAVAALAAGADSTPLNTTATAPTTPGTVYYGACVTAISAEADATNNCSSSVKITVTAAPKADLTVTVTATDAAVVAGGNAVIHATVTNRGAAAAAGTTLQWYRSADAAIDVGDTPLGSLVNVAALATNASASTLTTNVTAPSTPGPIYYGACVTAILGEADATNNCHSVQITITEAPKADLTVTVTANHTAPTFGQSVTLIATVTNSGAAAAVATTLTWYRSSDAAIGTDDTPLGSTGAVAALAAGASPINALTTNVTAPSTPGPIYYGACVTAILGEADATNNCHSVEITVTAAPKPDLTVAPPTAASLTVSRGATFTLTTTVTNRGAAAAASSVLTWRRSLDTTIGVDDTDLKNAVAVAALAVDASTDALISGAIGAPTLPGIYHYGACVAAVSDEANTHNNCSASVTITVPAIYTCTSGAAKAGTTGGTVDVDACQSCSSGFKLDGVPGDVGTACVATHYTCPANGTAKTGSTNTNADAVVCESCHPGFKQVAPSGGTLGDDGTTCEAITYTCSNGIAKTGTPPAIGNADVESCTTCSTGHTLGGPGGDECVATKYTCTDGIAKTGTPGGSVDVGACQSCHGGFKLSGAPGNVATTCVATVYTCSNGTVTPGTPPATGNADVESCIACLEGYQLNATTTACDPNPNFIRHSNGVTVLCVGAAVGATGTVGGTPYTKRVVGDIIATNAATTCTSGIGTMTNATLPFDGTTFNGDISHWDTSSVTTMAGMFQNASAFNGDIGSWDVSQVGDMSTMFNGASAFNGDIGSWNVSKVGDMSDMFNGARAFNGDIGSWNVSQAEDMSSMFNGATAFNQNIGSWDVGNVTDMASMFQQASAFNQDLSWNVSKVGDMSSMFNGARAFNGDIGDWNVSKVSTMSSMFNGASVFNQNIGSWDVSKVGDMASMFQQASAFNQDLSWNVTNVTDMSSMFQQASAFNGDIGSWDVSNVTDMASMFLSAHDFNQDIGSWDVSKVSTMAVMFGQARAFNQDLSWDVTNVTDMSTMFANAHAFNQDLSWNVSKVSTMAGMFGQARAFNQDLSWDVSNVTDMSSMFANAHAFNQDLSWDVSNVRNMKDMFNGATAFNGDISSWNVTNVTDMSTMFNGASVFNGDIGSWDVSNVSTMAGMFVNADAFDQDIGSWDTGNVMNMNTMFLSARDFNQDIGSWDVRNVTDMLGMFRNAGAFNHDLSGWCVSHISTTPFGFATGATAFGAAKPKWGDTTVASCSSP